MSYKWIQTYIHYELTRNGVGVGTEIDKTSEKRSQRYLENIKRTRPHMPDPFNILSYWRSSAMLETGINALLVSLDKRGSFFLQQVYQFLYK